MEFSLWRSLQSVRVRIRRDCLRRMALRGSQKTATVYYSNPKNKAGWKIKDTDKNTSEMKLKWTLQTTEFTCKKRLHLGSVRHLFYLKSHPQSISFIQFYNVFTHAITVIHTNIIYINGQTKLTDITHSFTRKKHGTYHKSAHEYMLWSVHTVWRVVWMVVGTVTWQCLLVWAVALAANAIA